MKSIRISWALKITGLYLGFVAIIATLVVCSLNQDFDLVAPDYYQQELNYQEILSAGKNQSLLSEPILLSTQGNTITIKFPEEFKGQELKGKVYLYSPVKTAWDKVISFNTTENILSIDCSALKNTRYMVKIDWTANGKKYYQQSEITIP